MEPPELEAAAPDLGADKACNVISALAPIEARTAEDSPASWSCDQIRPKPGQESFAGSGQLATILREDDIALGCERVRNRDAEPAGQVVVAGACVAQRV